jgi:WD40 repeat protein/tRNA A-37 threonylcarbamoyl transferase component Bud32
MGTPADRDELLDRLCAEYLEAAEAGHPPDRGAWLGRHPELAAELADFLDCLNAVVGRAAPLREAAGSSTASLTIDHPLGGVPPRPPASAPPGYELLGEIGAGGMGVVYRARQVASNRVVALKRVRAGELAGDSAVQRFQQEALAAASFDHPHIVPVYDVGVHGGEPFFCMKLVEGRTLGDWIADGWGPGGRLRTADGLRDGVRVLARVARAVHYAHQRGFLHRDLKPGNVLIDAEGTPYVTDFGLAKRLATLRADGEASLTLDGGVVGTLGYMAPEQARGEKGLTTAADVYSLGAILFYLATGRPLRPPTALAELLAGRLGSPPRPRAVNPRLDRDLEAICLKCLEVEPGRRYGSAEALAEELERWLDGRAVLTRPPAAWEWAWKWARRRKDEAGLAAAVVVVFLAGAAGVGWMWHQERAARKDEAAARREAQAQAAVSALTVAHSKLDRDGAGDPQELGAAMLWFARGLALAPSDDAGLRRTARDNLAAVYGRLHPLKDVRTVPPLATPDGRGRVVPLQAEGAPLHGTAGDDGTLRVWDTGTDPPALRVALRHPEPVTAAAVSFDGRVFAVGGATGTVGLYGAADGRPSAELPRQPAKVVALALSRDGRRLAAGCADGTARVWDTETKAELRARPLAHDDEVAAVAFSPDGHYLLTGSDDHQARRWPLEADPKSDAARPVLFEHQDYVRAVAFSPDGRLVATGSADRTAQVWEAATGRRVGPALYHGGKVDAVAFSADGRELVTRDRENVVRVWALDGAGRDDLAAPAKGEVYAVAVAPDGRTVLAGCQDGTAVLLDAATAAPAGRSFPQGGEVWAVALSPDGKLAATGGRDGLVHLWDAATGDRRRTLPPLEHPVRSVAFRPGGGQLLAGCAESSEGAAWVFDLAAPGAAGEPVVRAAPVWAVAYSPDGGRFATSAGDGAVQVWDAATRRPLGPPLTHDARVVAVAFGPGGRRLVTGGTDRMARVWDVDGREPVGEPMTHPGAVWSVSFSPDGRRVATGGRGRGVRLWDAETGRAVGPPLRHDGVVWGVAFAPDGSAVWSGGGDRTVRRWRLSAAEVGEDERVGPWAEAVTGLRLNPGGTVQVLTPDEWQARRGGR